MYQPRRKHSAKSSVFLPCSTSVVTVTCIGTKMSAPGGTQHTIIQQICTNKHHQAEKNMAHPRVFCFLTSVFAQIGRDTVYCSEYVLPKWGQRGHAIATMLVANYSVLPFVLLMAFYCGMGICPRPFTAMFMAPPLGQKHAVYSPYPGAY